MDSTLIGVDTSRRQVVDITDQVETFCTGRGDGLCSVFVPHATAGVALMETGSGSEADLVDTLERLLPPRRPLPAPPRCAGPRRRSPAPGPRVAVAGAARARRAASPSGTWQRVVLVDTNADNPDRQVRLSFVADSSAQLA